jgi:hypothetical protein
VWIELRQALSLGHILWIAALVVLVWWSWAENDPEWNAALGIFAVFISSLLMGVWTFQAEGGRRTRFLADLGLSPPAAWLGKQIVWGLLTTAIVAPFVVAIGFANQAGMEQFHHSFTSVFHQHVPGASAITFAVALSCLGYAAGQFAAILIPRAVTAAFVGLVMSGLLAPWTWLMIALGIPLLVSVAPLIVILLATTLGWSRNWLLEQATAKSWMRLALRCAISVVLAWAGIGAYRVFEVPRPDFVDEIAPLREAHGLPISPEEAQTAALYRQAVEHINWEIIKGQTARPGDVEQTAINGWEHAAEIQKRRLTENRDALQQGLAATERPTCAFNDPTRPITEMGQDVSASLPDCHQLALLILWSARELEARGQLDEALNRYVALLRMARHLANRGTMREWADGMLLESKVSQWIPLWAGHPEQTPERIEAGGWRIRQEAAQFPALRDAVLTQQFMIRRAIRDDWYQVLQSPDQADAARVRTAMSVFDRCCPWEHTRVLRVLDLVDAAQLHCLDMLEMTLAVPGQNGQDRAEIARVNLSAAVNGAGFAARASIMRDLHAPASRFSSENFFNLLQPGVDFQDRVPWNWLTTTFPLNMHFGQRDLSRFWDLRLRRELAIRTMLLQLKLAAFKKTHGDYPDQLDVNGFGLDAVDPYTGTEFGFRRHGFPYAIRVINGLTYAEDILKAGQPFLWSAGPGNVRRFTPMAADTEIPNHPTSGPSTPPAGNSAANSPLVFALP